MCELNSTFFSVAFQYFKFCKCKEHQNETVFLMSFNQTTKITAFTYDCIYLSSQGIIKTYSDYPLSMNWQG